MARSALLCGCDVNKMRTIAVVSQSTARIIGIGVGGEVRQNCFLQSSDAIVDKLRGPIEGISFSNLASGIVITNFADLAIRGIACLEDD